MKTMFVLLSVFMLASCSSSSDSGLLSCNSDEDCGEGLICNNLTGECVADVSGDGDAFVDGDGTETSEDGEDGDVDDAGEEGGDCADISTDVTELDFGCVLLGSEKTERLLIMNNSEKDESITVQGISVTQSGAVFTLSDDITLPATLLRGHTLEVGVKFEPLSTDPAMAVLAITSNSCDNSRMELPIIANVDCCPSGVDIDITPGSHSFGNIFLSDARPETEFLVCNTAPLDEYAEFCPLIVTAIESARKWENFVCLGENCIGPNDEALRILPGEENCKSFKVGFRPQDAGEYEDTIMVFNNSAIPSHRIADVSVEASASQGCLAMFPYPVDFGAATKGSTRERIASLHNYCPEDITINLVSLAELSGDNCDMFSFGEDVDAIQGMVLQGNNINPAAFTVKYNPTSLGENTCHIDLSTSLEGSPHMQYLIRGSGKEGNLPPVAVVSLESHGAAMNSVLEGVINDPSATWKFYGNSSYDPDGTIASGQWSILEWPENSETTLQNFGGDMSVYMQFDVPGTYRFQLEVSDNEGLKCEEPFIVEVHVIGCVGLSLVMDFTAGNPVENAYSAVDCDLGLRHQSSAQVCDDENINQSGACNTMQHAICNMPKHSDGAEPDGTREEISCSYLEDGNWIIEVGLQEDCDSTDDWQTIVNCWGTHDPEVTIRMYDPNNHGYEALFSELSTTLTHKGDSESWQLRKFDCSWLSSPIQIK